MNAHRKWIKSLPVVKEKSKSNTAQENRNIADAADLTKRSKNSKL
jgi:hypothetical protein